MGDRASWLGLIIGNSRLHWAWFIDTTLQLAWDTEHLSPSVVAQLINGLEAGELKALNFPIIDIPPNPQLYLATVVPQQAALWQAYENVCAIALDQLPLEGLYPTLGIDRALAVWGAGAKYGFPSLVIDAGTALTFTGADAHQTLVGGAILPGLKLQLQSLNQKTAALPPVGLPHQLPSRWALNTSEAIQSGVVYTVVAGICDFIREWWGKFPESSVVLTGGDRILLLSYLQDRFPDLAAKAIVDPNLIFWGIATWRLKLSENS